MVKINVITKIIGFEKLLNEAIGTLISFCNIILKRK